ncbi:hypothetical protein LXA43DRAFT_1108512 [Ganoderma leucocontextum]|nr:hypothetical protein LXA43DRAFT_1108512 [Ganoderma leucocontextum]
MISMSDEARPTKRIRIADSGPMLKQHDEFWFDDGNLVLVAGDTAFRIYRGLLTVQSRIFENVFVSASPSTDELLDGCPVVHLSDSPDDLVHLLRVLLPTSRKIFYLREGQPVIQFEEVFAVARLAHKYGIEDIQSQALSCLQDSGYFSCDLHRFQYPDPTKVSVQPVHAIGAVILARLTDTPSMLPCALYRCCVLGGDLLDGWTRADGMVEHLTQDDLKRCVNARAMLADDGWRAFCLVFDDNRTSTTCARPDECRAGLRWVRATILNGDQMKERPALAALRDWSREISQGRLDHRFCALCEKALQDRNKVGLGIFWTRLPVRFGLAGNGWP